MAATPTPEPGTPGTSGTSGTPSRELTAEEYDVLARAQTAEYTERMSKLERSIAEAEAAKAEFISSNPDDPQTAEQVRAHVVELVPDAKSTMRHLLMHAESEAVRAGIAKFVMAAGMQALKDRGATDEMDDLLKRLQNTKATA